MTLPDPSTTSYFDNVDRLALVEMRPQPSGSIPRLYEIARAGGEPLSLRAARLLLDPAVHKVGIQTGVIVEGPLPVGEVDGPLGACVLANALTMIGREADVIVPEKMVYVTEAMRRVLNGTFGIVTDVEATADQYDAGIAIEKIGRNAKGVHHSGWGAVFVDQNSLADDFIEQMNRDGKPTVGIGDLGNEIGFGAIFEQAREEVRFGKDCGCPCGDGLVTATATQVVIPAAVSNFGGYALASAIGVLAGAPLLVPSPAVIAEGVEAGVARGCLDGGYYVPGRLGEDGIPMEGVLGYVSVLRTISQQMFLPAIPGIRRRADLGTATVGRVITNAPEELARESTGQ